MRNAPIGIYDSGLGGLSVAREIRAMMPGEDLVYVADSAWCPYGERSREEIMARASFVTDALAARGCKMIVLACNTATIAAIDNLRRTHAFPIVGMEPAIKPAVESTRSRTIAVLATTASLKGEKFRQLVERFAVPAGVRVIPVACPGLVELVETGRTDSSEAIALAGRYIAPLSAEKVDTIVLGCSHYPFLLPVLRTLAGPGIRFIDAGLPVARHVRRVLEERALLNPRTAPGALTLLTTGDLEALRRAVPRMWPEAAATATCGELR